MIDFSIFEYGYCDANNYKSWGRPFLEGRGRAWPTHEISGRERNPKRIALAEWIGRSPGSIAWKLANLASLDPVIVASGRKGMGNASALDSKIWRALQTNWDAVALEAAADYDSIAMRFGPSPRFLTWHAQRFGFLWGSGLAIGETPLQ